MYDEIQQLPGHMPRLPKPTTTPNPQIGYATDNCTMSSSFPFFNIIHKYIPILILLIYLPDHFIFLVHVVLHAIDPNVTSILTISIFAGINFMISVTS